MRQLLKAGESQSVLTFNNTHCPSVKLYFHLNSLCQDVFSEQV